MTIKDIARLSGVGVTTVSRVLNDHPDVSEKTRRRVLAVVAEQGFQPNTNARHLKQQTSASIAIIVKGTMNMLFADLVERCQQLLQDAGRDGHPVPGGRSGVFPGGVRPHHRPLRTAHQLRPGALLPQPVLPHHR